MSEEIKEHRFHDIRRNIHEIITEADSPAGRAFDIALIIFIIASVLVVMLESVPSLNANPSLNKLFVSLEWVFTIFFTIEYVLRLTSGYKPLRYATSFFGIIDLLAILPSYLALIAGGPMPFLIIRALRILRIFRVFKLASFTRSGKVILLALHKSLPKITVFLLFVLVLVLINGSIMYLIEAEVNESFDSIPRSVYWAVVTITTVGYGDITPTTNAGQFIAAFVMILGYSVIAVPTGIISSEFIKKGEDKEITNTQVCQYCGKEGHDDDAKYCKHCSQSLEI